MGRFSVHLSVRLSPPLGHPTRPEAQPASPEAQPARPEAQPAMPEAQPARSEPQPAGQPQASGLAGWASGLAGWPRGGNSRTYERTENLPILQDFVPYRGRCPKRERKRRKWFVEDQERGKCRGQREVTRQEREVGDRKSSSGG